MTMAWMYLTPILYSTSLVDDKLISHGMANLRWLYWLNPMTPITVAYRDILYYGQPPHVNTLLNAAILGVGILIIGYWVFRKLQKGFAEEL